MTDSLQFGLFSMNMDACCDPVVAARVAQAAEAAGFESLWAGEHVVLPDPRTPASPMAPTDCILDPVVALTFLAAQTRRIRLGTGIIILPQRHPRRPAPAWHWGRLSGAGAAGPRRADGRTGRPHRRVPGGHAGHLARGAARL